MKKLRRLDLTPEKIEHLYWVDGLPMRVIAKQLHCPEGTILERMKRFNIPRRTIREAAELAVKTGRIVRNGRWFGKRGGIRIPARLVDGQRTYKYEHRMVWEQAHNTPVPPGWHVHHLNGIRHDNRPENLVALPRKRHGLITQCEPYKKRIKELEAKIKLLESRLNSQWREALHLPK